MTALDARSFFWKHGCGGDRSDPAGSVVYTQGDPADSILYLQDGEVWLSVVSEEGREAIIGAIEAPGLFGEDCLIDETTRMSTATTVSDCVIFRLDKAAVFTALRNDPLFAEFIVSEVLKTNVQLKKSLLERWFHSSEQRLLRALLVLSVSGKQAGEETIIPRIDQQTLANRVGTTRARVSYFMNKFRRLELITYGNGEIRIRRSRLHAFLNDRPNQGRNCKLRRALAIATVVLLDGALYRLVEIGIVGWNVSF